MYLSLVIRTKKWTLERLRPETRERVHLLHARRSQDVSKFFVYTALARPVLTDWGPRNESDDVPLNHPRIWWYLHDFVSVLARLADAGALDGRRSVTESARVGDRDLPRRQTLKRVHDVVPRLQTTGRAARRAQHLVRRPRAPRSRLRSRLKIYIFFISFVVMSFVNFRRAPSQPVNVNERARVRLAGAFDRAGVSSNNRTGLVWSRRPFRARKRDPSLVHYRRAEFRPFASSLRVDKKRNGAFAREWEVGTRVMYLRVTTHSVPRGTHIYYEL